MTEQKNSGIVGLDLDFLYAVTQSQSADDLGASATKFCQSHDFSRWIFGMAGPDKVLTNYPDAWLASYAKNRWHIGHDPVINAMNQRRRAITWDARKSQPFGQPLGAVEKAVVAERWEVGARAGVTAPVYDRPGHSIDFAVVAFSRETPLSDAEQRHHEPSVQLFATYFHSVASIVMLTVRPADGACTCGSFPTRTRLPELGGERKIQLGDRSAADNQHRDGQLPPHERFQKARCARSYACNRARGPSGIDQSAVGGD